MKKTFLAKRNALLSSTDVSWGAYALLVAVFVLLVRFVAPNFFWHVFAPVFESADALATESHTFFASFGNAAALTLQNEKLQEENAALANENLVLLEKATSLEALGSSSGLGKGITAGVVARPPESPYDTLVLAQGSLSGITLGMMAFGAGGVPIGRVSSLWADFSRVTLFSSSGTRTLGWVGHPNTPLTITGFGAGVMEASLVRSAGVAEGDSVFIPGPGKLKVGTVTRIDTNPSSPVVTLHITPVLNPFSITWVLLRDTGVVLP